MSKTTNGLWHQILFVTESKQLLFLKRLFLLHDIQVRRGGKSCVTRLAPQQWNEEVERMCLQGFLFEQMQADPEKFPAETLASVELGMVEGWPGSKRNYCSLMMMMMMMMMMTTMMMMMTMMMMVMIMVMVVIID